VGAAAIGCDLVNLCVWVKSNGGMGSLCRSRHELVFVLRNRKEAYMNNVQFGRFGRNRTNVWNYAGPTVSRARVGNPPHFVAALSGDVGSAAMLLRLCEHGIRYGDNGPLIINILNSPGPRPMDRVQTFFRRPIAPKIAADTRGS